MFFTTLLNVGPASLPLYPLQSLAQNSLSRLNPHDWEGNDGIAVYRDPKFISFSSFRSLPTERTSVKSTINSAQILLPYQTVPEHEVHSVVEEMVLLQPDPFLNELTNMYERTKEKGSVWVTFKRSSMKPKAKRKRLESAGEVIEYRCLVRATDAKKTISTSLAAKDYLRFQASYATVLKAHMDALKKRERKDKKKSAEGEKKAAADQNKPTSKPNP